MFTEGIHQERSHYIDFYTTILSFTQPGGPKCRRPTDALLVSELKLAERAEVLRRNLTVLRRTTTRLTTRLEELREHAQKLMEDVDRTEVRETRREVTGPVILLLLLLLLLLILLLLLLLRIRLLILT